MGMGFCGVPVPSRRGARRGWPVPACPPGSAWLLLQRSIASSPTTSPVSSPVPPPSNSPRPHPIQHPFFDRLCVDRGGSFLTQRRGWNNAVQQSWPDGSQGAPGNAATWAQAGAAWSRTWLGPNPGQQLSDFDPRRRRCLPLDMGPGSALATTWTSPKPKSSCRPPLMPA